MWPFGSKTIGARHWDLSRPLLRWSKNDSLTLGDAVEGTLVVGATGSGKSSGSGKALARALLDAGCGGLVLTAKPDETKVWRSYCQTTGRAKDLVVFGPKEPYRFNFLDFEMNHGGEGAGLVENNVQLFASVLDITERQSAGGGGRDGDGYWKNTKCQLMRNSVELLALATGRVSVPDLYRLVISAPTSASQIASDSWKATSFCYACFKAADKRAKSSSQAADFELVADYFLLEFPNLSEKTRSVIVSTFTSMIDVLNRSLLRDLFCTGTNLTPKSIENGKVVVIDLPVKTFAEVGVIAQVIWKYCFQRSIERRDLASNVRPVFLYADEAQHFVTSYDQQFATTCRSSRVAMVLLTQNLSTFEAALGGNEKAKAETASLLGNCNTKVFHANSDPATNQWASTLIGRTLQTFVNSSTSRGPDDWQAAFGMAHAGNVSAGFSEAYEFELQPSVFSMLRTGGPANRGIVDAIVLRNGKRFNASGRTWLPVIFQQEGRV